jgi:hypothetical protein
VPHPSFCKEWVGDARERVPTLCDFLSCTISIEGGPLLRCCKAGRRCCRQSALVSALEQDRSRIVLTSTGTRYRLPPTRSQTTRKRGAPLNESFQRDQKPWPLSIIRLRAPPEQCCKGFCFRANRIVQYINLLSCSTCWIFIIHNGHTAEGGCPHKGILEVSVSCWRATVFLQPG